MNDTQTSHRPRSVGLERTKVWLLPAALGAIGSGIAIVAALYGFAGKLFVTRDAQAEAIERHEDTGHKELREKVRAQGVAIEKIDSRTDRMDRNLIRLMVSKGLLPVPVPHGDDE